MLEAQKDCLAKINGLQKICGDCNTLFKKLKKKSAIVPGSQGLIHTTADHSFFFNENQCCCVVSEKEVPVEECPGLIIRRVTRLGVGKVHQVYFSPIPRGGISVPEAALDRAKAAADAQLLSDERTNYKHRNKQQSLGKAIHTMAHEIAMVYMSKADVPHEYFRKYMHYN